MSDDPGQAPDQPPAVFEVDGLNVYYGDFHAVGDVSFDIDKNRITAMIGPSGCGKSTVLRCFNRMNDLIDTAQVSGRVGYHGVDLYGEQVDPVQVRRHIGMVFQKPNPFPSRYTRTSPSAPRLQGSSRA